MSDGRQLRWQEPWFFSLRMRDKRGWQLKGCLIAAVFVAMMVGWYLDEHYGKGLRNGFTGAIFLSMGIAVFAGFLTDLGLSEIQATDAGIARAFYGHGVGGSLWRYQDILTFSFIPRESSERPFGLLILVMQASIVVLGVPDSMPGTDVVEFFQRHGVQQAQISNNAPRLTPTA